MVYTANAGQLFRIGERSVYLLSSMTTKHRQSERDHVRAFAAAAGLEVQVAQHAWEGQADLQSIGGNRYIATWGVRSVRESLEDVRPLLPPSARLLDVQICDPFFHGDVCLNPIANRAGDVTLLAHAGAFVSTGIEAVRHFAGGSVDVLGVDRDDAVAYACNSLCVAGTLLVPSGVSAGLRGQLVRRGFTVEDLDLPELLGKGGGGPRCLVNELRGLVLQPGAPDYASRRDDLVAEIDKYPEQVAASEPAPHT
jgi:N-dimethylarginine dimethylaminohydrolase